MSNRHRPPTPSPCAALCCPPHPPSSPRVPLLVLCEGSALYPRTSARWFGPCLCILQFISDVSRTSRGVRRDDAPPAHLTPPRSHRKLSPSRARFSGCTCLFFACCVLRSVLVVLCTYSLCSGVSRDPQTLQAHHHSIARLAVVRPPFMLSRHPTLRILFITWPVLSRPFLLCIGGRLLITRQR